MRLGSIRIKRSSSGDFCIKSEIKKQLSPADFPEPVVPEIKRCGAAAKSTITGSPVTELPRQIGNVPFARLKAPASAISRKVIILR